MRTHTSTRVLLWMSLAATVLLWPAEALAQRGRGGHGRGGGSGRVVTSGRAHRPVYYRPYYYRPYSYSSFYWGAYGWNPYYPFWYTPYPYGGYGGFYDNLGEVRTQVKPRQAQVYVDGYYAGLVDDYDGWAQRLKLKPGGHEVSIYLKGYRPIKETVYAQPGQTVNIKGDLMAVAPGEIEPEPPKPTSPPPATPQRQRPYAGRRVAPPAPDDPMSPVPEADLSASPSSASPSAAPPSSAARSAYGTLSIRVQPRSAVVLIDGEKWEGGDGQERLSIELSEGTHKVEVQKEGFTTYATEVNVRRGQVTSVNVSLRSPREI